MEMQLNAEIREQIKKGGSRKLRKLGKIPVVLYGNNKPPLSISLNQRETQRLLESGASRKLMNLVVIQGGAVKKECLSLFKEIQRNPLTNEILHIDLYEVERGKKIHAVVPINLIGKPIGVTDQGGALQVLLRQIHIQCVPEQMPETIDVNVENLSLGDSISIKDIPVSNEIQIAEDQNRVVASIVTIKVVQAEQTASEESAATEESTAQPEEKKE
jgi:large subunit ribosomal protein L25